MQITWQKLTLLLATGLGVGRVPKIPGTAGTLLGMFLYFGLSAYSFSVYLLATVCMFLMGVWVCEQAAQVLGDPDPKEVVWDEIVGYLIAMAAAPRGLFWAMAGFVLFRAFDILKPGLVGWAERRFSGGWGIMLDDMVAGVLALLVLKIVEWGMVAL